MLLLFKVIYLASQCAGLMVKVLTSRQEGTKFGSQKTENFPHLEKFYAQVWVCRGIIAIIETYFQTPTLTVLPERLNFRRLNQFMEDSSQIHQTYVDVKRT